MNKIPLSWGTRPFGELNKFYGANIDPASHPAERFELYSIPAFPTGKPEQPLGSEVGSTKQLVEHNDVLISKINPRINRVWQVGPSMGLRQIASSEWIGFRCPQMDARFFRYYFTGPIFRDLLCSDVTGVGGSLTRAQPKRVSGFPVPIAPVDEQKRIADKLDTVLTRVEAVNERLARVAPILKRFRQSVLAAATSGRLTEDWRSLDASNTPWRQTTLGDLIDEMRNGLATKPDENPGGQKILRISAVRPGVLDTADHRYLTTDESEARLYGLRKGDLLYTRYNGSLDYVGVCAMVSEDLPEYVYPDKLIRVRAKAAVVLPKYVEIASSAAEARAQIEGYVKSSAGQKGISGGNLKALRIAVPAINEQAEIVRRVETLFAFADRLEVRLQAAQTAADRLTPSLLAKAFRGELVPQDPSDEPASELLKRLASSTTTVSKRGRRSKAAQ